MCCLFGKMECETMRTADCNLTGENHPMKPALVQILKGITAIVAVAFSGCASGPDFVRPVETRDLRYMDAAREAKDVTARYLTMPSLRGKSSEWEDH